MRWIPAPQGLAAIKPVQPKRYSSEFKVWVPQWANAHGAGSAFAGYYVSHREGGLIYVGFTGSQSERIAALQQNGGLIAPSRVRAFPFTPAYSLSYLESLEAAVANAIVSMTGITGIQIDIEHNRVDVGAVDVSQTTSALQSQFGAQAPINVHFQAQGASSLKATSAWGSPTGPTKGGERIWSDEHGLLACSIGYGAWDRGGVKPDGSTLYRHFILTAGHCFYGGEKVYQFNTPGENPEDWWERDLGYVRRDGWAEHGASGYGTDAQAIRVEDPGLVPRLIRWSPEQNIRIRIFPGPLNLCQAVVRPIPHARAAGGSICPRGFPRGGDLPAPAGSSPTLEGSSDGGKGV